MLVALYNATGGPNWTNNSNWLSNQPLSEWFGVTVDTTDRVEHLNLSSNNLRGTLPTGLAQLSNLKSLNLNNNRLRGGVPSELGSLTHLEDLDLATNELTGTIPTQLGNLSILETLNLSWNELSGAVSFAVGQPFPARDIVSFRQRADWGHPIPVRKPLQPDATPRPHTIS